MKNKIQFLLLFLVIFSCAHHRDVRPGVAGVHKIKVKAGDGEEGTQDAIAQANHFCEKRDRTAAFVSEEENYVGDMKEQDYKTAKKVTKVAKVIGGSAWVFGRDKKVNDAGGILGVGASAMDSAIGDGYSVEMKFKCL